MENENYTQSTLTNGPHLVLHTWLVPSSQTTLLIVHGLGEHGGRYHPIAKFFNDLGYTVRAYDHVGHGLSEGKRGCLHQDYQLIDDLTRVIEDTRRAFGQRMLLLGHSLGGLVAASWVIRHKPPPFLQGLILTSPAFAAQLNAVQKILLAVLPALLPNLCVSNKLNVNYLSHDPKVIQSYQKDPLVHDRISGRLARFIMNEAKNVQRAAHQWRLPTLLLYAGDDHLVEPAGSRTFAQNAPNTTVSSEEFPLLYHEILNELDSQAVYHAIQNWVKPQ